MYRRHFLLHTLSGCALASLASARAVTQLAPSTRYFSLADVRLGDGPFLDAQQRDAAYLRKLEPDRMLHNFRVNAGLPPKAEVYGGWESVEPWVEIRCHGHTLGHYLSAVAFMYASTGDASFAERADYIVAELAACQAQRGGGLLCAFPDDAAPLVDSLAGRPFAGVPWYTMHKIVAGLRDAYEQRASMAALPVFVKLVDWIDTACRDVPDERFQKMLDREHGGMNEVLADAYTLTGERRYLQLAKRFSHRKLLEPLARHEDALNGLHANTQIPKVVGFSRISQVDIQPDYERAAKFFWHTVVETRSYATGGNGDSEHFFPVSEFAQRLGSAKTMETCCTHNMLRLTRALFKREPQAQYTDYFERALFNGILASQDPDSGMMTYFQSTRPGYVKLYHTPFDSFWCCTGSGMENHARYGETIYAHDDEALYVNLFMASTLHWRERGLTVTQETRFPDEETVTLRFTCEKKQRLKLRIRHPSWCDVLHTTWNSKGVSRSREPGSYHEIPGDLIRSGDVLEIRLPMKPRLEPLPNAPEHRIISYGPLVLAGRLGTRGVTPGAQLIVNERESGTMLNEAIEIPRWSRNIDELATNLTRKAGDALAFTARGFDGGAEVELIPWFRIAHERYNLYWHQTLIRSLGLPPV